MLTLAYAGEIRLITRLLSNPIRPPISQIDLDDMVLFQGALDP